MGNDKTINDRGHDLPLQTPVQKPHLKIERGNDNKQVTWVSWNDNIWNDMSFEFVLLLADIFTILFNSLFMIDVSNKVRKGNIYNEKGVKEESVKNISK